MPVIKLPIQTLYHRLIAIGYGAILLVWLSTENRTLWLTSLLGAGLSIVVLFLSLTSWWGGRTYSWKTALIGAIILGGLSGLGSVLGTVFLMVFKNAQHAHLTPDFSNEIILGITSRTGYWMVAGALFGGAVLLGFFALAKRQNA